MINNKFLTSLMAGGILLTTSCSNDKLWDYDRGRDDGYVDVIFDVAVENASFITRATDAQGPGQWQSVGRGNEIDMLIYAVYEKNGNEYQLLSQYRAKEIPQDLEESVALKTALQKSGKPGQGADDGDDVQHGNDLYDMWYDRGQGLIKADFSNNGIETFELRLMRGKTYYLAFWAQSSKTGAYDTSDLEKVKVDYANALNNDETRDAFCKMEEFTVAEGQKISVTLYRPFAQINVGTTGAEATALALTCNAKPYTTSSVRIKGVYDTFNVIEDKVTGNKITTEVEFKQNTIPAYYKYSDAALKDLTAEDFAKGPQNSSAEEFLMVDLDQNGSILPYQTYYPTIWWFDTNNHKVGEARTETFKYLSMTYVLVPSVTNHIPDYDEDVNDDKTGNDGTQALDGTSGPTDKEDSGEPVDITIIFYDSENGEKTLGVPNVPTQRNWRTNILGGLTQNLPSNGPEDPKIDPDNPPKPGDDPSRLISETPTTTTIITDYYGEYHTPNK